MAIRAPLTEIGGDPDPSVSDAGTEVSLELFDQSGEPRAIEIPAIIPAATIKIKFSFFFSSEFLYQKSEIESLMNSN